MSDMEKYELKEILAALKKADEDIEATTKLLEEQFEMKFLLEDEIKAIKIRNRTA